LRCIQMSLLYITESLCWNSHSTRRSISN
jgi:hypothetical protein